MLLLLLLLEGAGHMMGVSSAALWFWVRGAANELWALLSVVVVGGH